jgi:hypothetical protein
MNLKEAQAIIENSVSHTEVVRAAQYLSAEVNRFRNSSERWLAEATKLGGFVTALENQFEELVNNLLDVQQELAKVQEELEKSRSGHLENNARKSPKPVKLSAKYNEPAEYKAMTVRQLEELARLGDPKSAEVLRNRQKREQKGQQ